MHVGLICMDKYEFREAFVTLYASFAKWDKAIMTDGQRYIEHPRKHFSSFKIIKHIDQITIQYVIENFAIISYAIVFYQVS